MNAAAHTHTPIDETKPVRALLALAGVTQLLAKEGVTEVAINRPGEIWYEQNSRWVGVKNPGLTYDVCRKLGNSLAVKEANNSDQLRNDPICPVTLPDGERGQIVVPPACERGCISLTIRKPSSSRFSLEQYSETGRLETYRVIKKKGDIDEHEKEMVMCIKNGEIEKFFRLAVKHKLNLIFGGATGSGKTTFTKAIVDLYSPDRRYITIEDIHELNMPNHPNRVHMFFGPHIDAKFLVKSCMRMKADHIFMSELRGDETWAYLDALNTGHKGSVTTGHFNDCASASARISSLVKQSDIGMTLDYDFIYKTVETSIDASFYWEGTYLKEVRYEPEERLRLLNGE